MSEAKEISRILESLSKREVDAIHKMAPGARRSADREAQQYLGAHSDPDSPFNKKVDWIEKNPPEWTTFKGNLVLKIKKSKFIAVPLTGRKNARKFDIIDVKEGEYLTQLPKSEVNGWLAERAYDEYQKGKLNFKG